MMEREGIEDIGEGRGGGEDWKVAKERDRVEGFRNWRSAFTRTGTYFAVYNAHFLAHISEGKIRMRIIHE